MSTSPAVLKTASDLFPVPPRRIPIEIRNAPHVKPALSNYQDTYLGNSAWSALSQNTLAHLDRLRHLLTYPANTTIYTEGQLCHGIFVLCRGEAKLHMSNAEGRTLIVGVARPGDLLGLQECLTSQAYGVALETTMPCEMAFVLRDDFMNFLNTHSDARRLIDEQLISDCRAAHNFIRTIGLSQTITERLARVFLHWAQGSKYIDGCYRINIGFTHDEIGQLIGVRRETVSRTLSQMKRQGIAELSGATLMIHNKAVLERMAG